MDDHNLLLAIQGLLDGQEWSSDTIEQIASLMIDSGYRIRDLNECRSGAAAMKPTDEINWDDPVERLQLIERVGGERYAELQREHQVKATVAIVGGHRIVPHNTQRFGRIFIVGDSGQGFATQAEAEAYAADNPKSGDIAWDDPQRREP